MSKNGNDWTVNAERFPPHATLHVAKDIEIWGYEANELLDEVPGSVCADLFTAHLECCADIGDQRPPKEKLIEMLRWNLKAEVLKRFHGIERGRC